MGNGIIAIHEELLLNYILLLNGFKLNGATYRDRQVILKVESNCINIDNANVLPVYTKNDLGVIKLTDIQISQSYLDTCKCVACGNLFVK
jgi:hypothetical protein